MGKSAGKWIKTVLFGKKNSKSNYSKNGTPDKKSAVKNGTPDNEDPARDSSFIPDQLVERAVENLELEQGLSGSQGGAVGVGYVDQGIDSPKNEELAPVSDEEKRRQEEAATKTQAVFRGYLARRAFRALKGIIRLQALIRGHLVRRQAVATLRCMQAIVKLQAVARGRKVRLSDDIPEVGKKLNLVELQVFAGHSGSFLGPEKLAVHPFIRKLLLILPTAMPLSLQYDPAEPNSAQNWLERWSLSRFWEPPVKTKKTIKSKVQRKPEAEHATKSKRTIRKASTTSHGENGGVASSEMDKPKRIPRKVTSQAEEQSQSELERVKRNLRKVSASAVAATEKPDPETEKPQPPQSVEIVASPPPIDVLEKETVISPENLEISDAVVNQQESADLFEAHEKAIKEEPVDTQHDELPVAEIPPMENGVKTESAPSVEDESSCKEDQSRKENQKVRKRRSLPAKADYTENISQNSPSLPSYMAATESAKAKLRAQGAAAAKLAEEVIDYGNARRHSLPAPTNGKLTSLSPRIQKPVQVNGKGTKVNKSLSASRDEKAGQPGWRR